MTNSTVVTKRELPSYKFTVSNDFIEVMVHESNTDKGFSAQLTFKHSDKVRLTLTLNPTELEKILEFAQAASPFVGNEDGISKSENQHVEPLYGIHIGNVELTATEKEMKLFKEMFSLAAEKISTHKLLNNK